MANLKPYLQKNIIFATADERQTEIDKQILKTVGFREFSTFSSGIELALYLVDIDLNNLQRDYIVMCYPTLTDMSAVDFVELMSLHPLAVHQPIIGIATKDSEAAVFIKKTFTKILTRPLSPQSLEESVAYADKYELACRKKLEESVFGHEDTISSKEFYAKLAEFQNALLDQDPKAKLNFLSPAQALYAGYDLLRDKDINQAIPSLLKALSDENSVPQASAALASAYAATGKVDLVRKYLLDAIHAYAFIDNDEKMFNLTARYKERFHHQDHPLMEQAQRYIDENRLKDFIEKMKAVDRYYPVDEETSDLARICLKNGDPNALALEMQAALGIEFVTMGKALVLTVDRAKRGRDEARKKDIPLSERMEASKSSKKAKQASLLGGESAVKKNLDKSKATSSIDATSKEGNDKNNASKRSTISLKGKDSPLAKARANADARNHAEAQAIAKANREKISNIRQSAIQTTENITVTSLRRAGVDLPEFGSALGAPPRITRFDEGADQVFLEKEDNSSLTWKVIKGTLSAYKSNNK